MIARLGDRLKSHRVGLTLSRNVPLSSEDDTLSLSTPRRGKKFLKGKLLKNYDLDNEALSIDVSIGEEIRLKNNDTVVCQQLKPGDVLLTGKFVDFAWSSMIGDGEFEAQLYCNNNIYVLRPDDRLNPEYLTLWFRTESAQAALHSVAIKYYRGMHGLTKAKVLDLPIEVPSFDRQLQLVRFYKETLDMKRQCQENIRQRQFDLQQEFNSLSSEES